MAAQNVVLRYTTADVQWRVYSAVVLAIVAFLGYRDIELSSQVLGVVLALEAAVVLVLDVVTLAQGGAEGVDAESLPPARLTEGSPASA